ncbi:MAG TPA: GNAT family N-acetyltransferase [Thermomicrobiales bacterium]|nr:GNAT family N-acetyltransferase [Thermomicrobiales bacterium]
MAPVIRPATIHDREGVSRIATELGALHARALPDRFREASDPMPSEYFQSLLGTDESLILVADDDGDIVGYEILRLQETPPIEIVMPRRFVFVSDLAVLERSQGQGIGRLLVDAALAWARAQGASGIELGVYEFNEAAIAFYEHMGFRTVKRTMGLAVDRA